MEGHLNHAKNAIDEQFGEGVGRDLLPPDRTIVLNKVSSLDAMFEIIVDGHIIGRLRFEIPKRKYSFILTLEGGRRLGRFSKQKWVSIHDGVLSYLKKGANLMLPGVAGCDSDIEVNDEVWISNPEGMVVGVGIARMSGSEMAQEAKGFAVKIREIGDPLEASINENTSTWEKAVSANDVDLQRIEDEAVSFIRRTTKEYDAPVVVGFSGGKDSLVAYLLVEKALETNPPLFFMDTGLELPETLDYLHSFAQERNAQVIGQEGGDHYWESIDSFGPPARDFRWCCKVLKLGPAATSISEEMGGSTLSFMGQRRLESFQRSIEPRVTSNPWVPGQTSANPIRNWNALEVWLYIFREEAPFNPLYNKGYHRMGCFLCPSSPLAEFEGLRKTHPELHNRWLTSMYEWAKKLGFPEEWVDLGLWRWKTLPKGQLELVEKLGLDITPVRPGPTEEITLTITKGVSPCTSAGFSLEGQFSSGIDLIRASEIMSIFGKTKVSEEMGALRTTAGENTINLFSSGSLVIRGENEHEIELLTNQVERAIKRALFCQACGSCVPQCTQNALNLEKGKISVDDSKCINCLECDSWPCPTYLA
jgi:phosphoadenosine phosphosulfate reductase